ncbi:MAG: methylated-DNA--[protein]-cysteine S-methyltransferase [Leptospiraceae bacterium]|nr:methylated-DNA--[protein]-cysteine S-methyltransferase [Leptospiraceae bacterium]
MLEQDPSFEGLFVVAVRTTGIFCRPTCRARKAKRENVEFYPDSDTAAAAGFRPCKICRPTELPVEDVPEFFRVLSERLGAEPLERLTDQKIRSLGFVPATVRRWFKRRYNMTFQAWQRMLRMNAAFQRLQQGENVTVAALASGYESLSGFGASFRNAFGFAPSQKEPLRMITARRLESPIGPLLACAVDEGICYLQFMDQRLLESELKDMCRRLKAVMLYGEHPHLAALADQLAQYFDGDRRNFDLPIAVPGTDFQRRAWRALQEIPYGTTASYADQARALGSPGAVRATGTANRLNRVTIVVPCHRVIGSNGGLSGYGGGVWRKQWLLQFEKRTLARGAATVGQAGLLRRPG